MGKKWFEQSPGNTSVMRIALLLGIITGMAGMLSGIILAIFIFISKSWEGITLVTVLVGSSASIIAVGDIAKGIQKKAEN